MQDPHFINWMRTAGLPNFSKLYGVIEEELVAATYQIKIVNRFNTTKWNGEKHFKLTQAISNNYIGGKNYFLAVAFIFFGVCLLTLALVFLFGIIKSMPEDQIGFDGTQRSDSHKQKI